MSANVIGKLLAVGKCLDCQRGFVQSICLNCAPLLLHMVRPDIWYGHAFVGSRKGALNVIQICAIVFRDILA